jgi:glyoxylase-like metal-dependent hydrolase (beta-lactamase superfamily II)
MEKIAEDVWLLSGFPASYFNVYLLGDVLVDAATRWGTQRILRQLKDRQLRMVALTHCHPDHQGAAKAVCDTFRIPLACHRAAVPAVEGQVRMLPHNWVIRLGEWAWAGPRCRVERILDGGDEVAGFRVVHAPGHTPGHCMLVRESDGLCIAGDVLANVHFLTGKPGLREPPSIFSVDVAQNRRSIQTLVDLNAKVVCFGHGPPLRNPDLLERFMAKHCTTQPS